MFDPLSNGFIASVTFTTHLVDNVDDQIDEQIVLFSPRLVDWKRKNYGSNLFFTGASIISEKKRGKWERETCNSLSGGERRN